MNDPALHRLFQQARRAQQRLDLSAREYGFETRLMPQLAELAASGPGTLYLLWRSVAGCAAMVGILAVWFILAQTPHATEDDLSAFWDSGQASYDGEFLN
jgi:hypothetical protein